MSAFLSHLLAADSAVQPLPVRGLDRVLEEHGGDATKYVLGELINRIHDAGSPLALVIDDWHSVDACYSIAAMEFLLDNGCHHLMLIVTSRSTAGLPLARLRVRDELIEFDAEALRFTESESLEFLLGVSGLRIDRAQVAKLTETTEGWVAALQLASLSLRNRDDADAFIANLTGRHHAIGEYLPENVVDSLPSEQLEFMLSISITERVCAELAQHLTGVRTARNLLEGIEDSSLFLQAVDDDRTWFRFHHLFAEFLRSRLEKTDPRRARQLHRAASDWFADHGLLSDAVDQALAADDRAGAAQLIEARGMALIESSRMATLLGLIDQLPAAVANDLARIQLLTAWGHVLLRHLVRAELALSGVEPASDFRTASKRRRRGLQQEVDLVRAVGAVFSDRVSGVTERIAGYLEHPEADIAFFASAAGGIASFVALNNFDYDGCRRWQQWAAGYHERSAGLFSPMYNACVEGLASVELLEIDRADRELRRAVELGVADGPNSYTARLAGAGMGALRYAQGALDEAACLLDASAQLGHEVGFVDMLTATYGLGARIKALQGDIDGARQRLDQGLGLATDMSLPRLTARLINEQIRIGLPLSEADTRRLSRPRSQPAHSDGIAEMTAELDEGSAIRLLLADGAPVPAAERARELGQADPDPAAATRRAGGHRVDGVLPRRCRRNR